MKNHASSKGFTLIEVLIAVVILAVGLLGMASLLLNSMQSSQNAYLRSQASMLTYDLIERMRANQEHAVTTNAYTLAANAAATSDPGCASSCPPSDQAQKDLHDWRAALAAGIPEATAAITRSNDNQYQISIIWQEAGNPTTDSEGNTVAQSFTLRVDL